jgi:hypothetical protein
MNFTLESSGVRTCKRAERQNQLNNHILNRTVYKFFLTKREELHVDLRK